MDYKIRWVERLLSYYGVLVSSEFVCYNPLSIEIEDIHPAVISAVCSVIFSLSCILTPTSKEAYMIYGIGGTIDYIKTNETAKQLPDKCVNALDAFIDKLNEDIKWQNH